MKKWKIILGLFLAAAIAGGVYAGVHFYSQSVNYVITDNARVTTTLISVASNVPGSLERFTVYEGRHVEENEIIGWVENGEAMRAPFNGLVVQTNAVQDQLVAPGEPLALIADLGGLHIQANIEETEITKVQLGQPVTVTIDGFGNRQFDGYVSEIGHVTQAELAGTALFFNTGGTFTRVTHLIPVKINIVDDINLGSFIGVNARVRIPVAVRTEQPHTTPPESITARGTVESVESRNVYTTMGLRVEEVFAEVGDYVTEGHVLAILNTEDLVLTIAQQRAALGLARQNSSNLIQDSMRMLNEASTNLQDNTNMHILTAETALNSAAISLESAQKNYDDARRDYNQRSNPQVIIAESSLRSARVELDRAELNHENLNRLYTAGVLPREDLRQSENILTHAWNNYNDARTNYENATELMRRSLEQLELALYAANSSYAQARELLNAAQVTAQQDLERLRSNVTSAQTSANLEHMEITLRQLERQLEDSTITAPVSGTITSAIAREGATGMGLLFVIEDTNNLRVITRFREYDIGRIREGTLVTITTDSSTTEYTGVITRINPAAASLTPVVEFEAEVLVTSPITDLRIGMNTRVNILLD